MRIILFVRVSFETSFPCLCTFDHGRIFAVLHHVTLKFNVEWAAGDKPVPESIGGLLRIAKKGTCWLPFRRR